MLRRLTSARAVHTLLIAASLVVSLNPLCAQCVVPAQSLGTGAMVLIQSGDVSKQGDRAGYRLAIPPCGIVNQQQVIKTGPDGYAKLQVSDGSTFEVLPNSEVTFRKTYGIGDLLNVWMGKGKVYIQHLNGLPNPNNVTTPTAWVLKSPTVRAPAWNSGARHLFRTRLAWCWPRRRRIGKRSFWPKSICPALKTCGAI